MQESDKEAEEGSETYYVYLYDTALNKCFKVPVDKGLKKAGEISEVVLGVEGPLDEPDKGSTHPTAVPSQVAPAPSPLGCADTGPSKAAFPDWLLAGGVPTTSQEVDQPCSTDRMAKHYKLAEALRSEGRLEEAIEHYELCLDHEEDYPQLAVMCLLNIANSYRATDRTREAVERYQRALRLDEACLIAHNNLGVCLDDLGQTADAIWHYEQALVLDPTFAEADNNLGNVLAAQGKYQEAIRHFSKAVENNPSYKDALNNLGVALKAVGRPEEAIAQYQRATELDPRYPWAHINWAECLREAGKPDEALEHARHALELDPKSAAAFKAVGCSLLVGGREGEAAEYLEHSIAMSHGRDVEAMCKLAMVFRGQKDTARAQSMLEAALRVDQESSEVHHELGVLLDDLGNTKLAKRHYLRALKCGAENVASTHLNLGAILEKEGVLQEAKGHLEKAVQLDRSSALANAALAVLIDDLGEAKVALEFYEDAIRLYEADVPPSLRYNAALACESSGETAKYRCHIQTLMRSNSTFADVKSRHRELTKNI